LNARTTEEVVLSWIANHLASNILGNVRIDMLVTHAARIAAARASLKAEA
jgi:hypothetical protein